MPTGTTFDPKSVIDFTKDKMQKNAQGMFAEVTAGTSQDIDYTLTDDHVLNGGGRLLVKDATWGDSATFRVVHPTLGVLSTFITNWPINPDCTEQVLPTVNFPAKPLAGLKLRIVYNSVGTVNPKVGIGYNLEKVLE